MAVLTKCLLFHVLRPPQKELQSEGRRAHNICDLLGSRNIRWISVTLWLVW